MIMIGSLPIGVSATILFVALVAVAADATSSDKSFADASENKSTSSKKDDGAPPAADIDADAIIGEALLLEVEVNGHSTGKIGEFTLRNGNLMARPKELRDLGIRVPDHLAMQSGQIALSELAGLTYSLDMQNQILRVTAGDAQ